MFFEISLYTNIIPSSIKKYIIRVLGTIDNAPNFFKTPLMALVTLKELKLYKKIERYNCIT